MQLGSRNQNSKTDDQEGTSEFHRKQQQTGQQIVIVETSALSRPVARLCEAIRIRHPNTERHVIDIIETWQGDITRQLQFIHNPIHGTDKMGSQGCLLFLLIFDIVLESSIYAVK